MIPGAAPFPWYHRENLVTILVNYDAAPVNSSGDAINNVVRYGTSHLAFVEDTIGNVIEEYSVRLGENEHVAFLKFESLRNFRHQMGGKFAREFATLRKLLCLRRRSKNSGAQQQRHCE